MIRALLCLEYKLNKDKTLWGAARLNPRNPCSESALALFLWLLRSETAGHLELKIMGTVQVPGGTVGLLPTLGSKAQGEGVVSHQNHRGGGYVESAILKGAVASVEGHSPLETSRDGMDSSFPSGSWMPEGEASTRTIHTGRLPGTQEDGGEGTESGKSKKKPLAPGLSPASRIRVAALPFPSNPRDK